MPKVKSVEIEWIVDESPDLSHLYTDAQYHYGKDGGNWDHVSEEVKAATIEKYGLLWAACEAYAIEDKKRLFAFYNNKWHMTGCVAHARVSYPHGIAGAIYLEDFRSAGLWGIESDSSDEYRNEIETDQLGSLKRHLEQLGVDTTDFWEKYEEGQDG